MDSYRPDSDRDPQETQEWVESLDSVVEAEGRERAQFLIARVLDAKGDAAVVAEVKRDVKELCDRFPIY